MKYYIQIKPKDKPVGLYLLESLRFGHHTTTEIVENAIPFKHEGYVGISPNNLNFLIYDILRIKPSELTDTYILNIISEQEVAQIQELATWKSTLMELPKNGECIVFRLQDTLSIIRKGYFVNGNNSWAFFELIDNKDEVSHNPYYQIKKDKEEILWKPLIY